MRQSDLPSALSNTELLGRISREQPAFFLDYDGTLTPIVSRPEDAVMSEAMRGVVKELASHCRVSIVSGRDKRDVQHFVKLEELVYAGSHGFDISGPGGMQMQNEEGKTYLPLLDQAQEKLNSLLSEIRGSQVERKKFSIAIHYRNAAEDDVPRIQQVVEEVHKQFPAFRRGFGKKVFELQPNIEWDKGKAVLWLIDHLDLNRDGVLPFYIGDDLTDEDAFKAVRDRGVGILVGDHGQDTNASFALQGVPEVEAFLNKVIHTIA